MSRDEPFPLSHFSPRLQAVICGEFGGRCPSLQEVAAIPDARWLTTPAIGPALLRKIRAVGQCEECPAGPLSDGELLARLAALQEELRLLQQAVRTAIPARAGGPRRLLPRPASGHGPQERRSAARAPADHGWSTNP
ncbi:hypothetical protein HPT29_011250 [Microvirga terrae]|uniref:Uncharacterized protein n=1 Tax=Microvirga terrae TaxID=2740529 RepID=A0ABY5RZC7_9HYPH|nr:MULTISPECIES: hypothetical protein [Microvirga]MBQ0818845.1 hypothetical protein [Microvirga sp. HBU67558]UVF19621.1 hypothetical protein HPT29_000210 [Microvirga terrae]UVF21651.1 hypothetical protein HPT29_011250 [Microvirga terrae]